MRVNNVRNAWKIEHSDSPQMRSFYDSSLWESRKSETEGALKRLIRDGVFGTSAVCVLVGTQTWFRRWARYEIARAVIDNRGLLAVHINSICHHQTKAPHPFGPNPLTCMAVGKIQADAFAVPKYYLFEWNGREWIRYMDHMDQVNLPIYLMDPMPNWVMPLSSGTPIYDFCADNGHKNIGAWIDTAAIRVGR
jgi:hypothetical protein